MGGVQDHLQLAARRQDLATAAASVAASLLAPRTAQRYEWIWVRVRTWLRDNGHPASLRISAALYQEFALFVTSDPNMERPRQTLG